MPNHSKQQRVSHFLNTLNDIRRVKGKNLKILDLGCGAGDVVKELQNRGYDAYGCDISFKSGPYTEQLKLENIIRLIDLNNYSIPFESDYFDIVISDQVFEHVQNYRETILEMCRVMKSDGACLHIFPSRYSILEPHFKVPFGTILHDKRWFEFWARFGARRPSQRGKSPKEIAQENIVWVDKYTNYLPHDEIIEIFQEHFENVFFAEKNFLKFSKRGKYYYQFGKRAPWLFLPYRYMKSNVLFAERKVKSDANN